jgi:hypothetical protein
MRRIRLVLLLALSTCVVAQNPPTPPDPKAVALEQAFADAEQHHDMAWLAQHVPDDVLIFNGAGDRSSKQEMMAMLPDIHLAQFQMSDISTTEVAPGHVLLVYLADIVTSYKDFPAAAYRFRVASLWDVANERMLFHQSSYTLTAPPTVEQLIGVEKKLIKAEAERDVATISVLLADDSISVSGTGVRMTKQDVLAAVPKIPPHEPDASDFTLLPLGFDGVMINYRLRSTETRNGTEKVRLYTVTSVWRRNPDGKWQLVYHQGTENPQLLGVTPR